MRMSWFSWPLLALSTRYKQLLPDRRTTSTSSSGGKKQKCLYDEPKKKGVEKWHHFRPSSFLTKIPKVPTSASRSNRAIRSSASLPRRGSGCEKPIQETRVKTAKRDLSKGFRKEVQGSYELNGSNLEAPVDRRVIQGRERLDVCTSPLFS